jgi:hypothetical protein
MIENHEINIFYEGLNVSVIIICRALGKNNLQLVGCVVDINGLVFG